MAEATVGGARPGDTVGPIKTQAGRFVVRLSRYRIVGAPPQDPVCVLVAAPHTSNWDFPLMIAMAWATGVTPVWLGKQELFAWPFGRLFRRLGGIAVDRDRPGNLVEALVARARSGEHVAILIPPEGTRVRAEHWRSGFRRIASQAGVPVVLSFLDGPTRTGGYGPTLRMTDDVTADMDAVRAFYADKHGVRPGRFTPPRLREEGADAGPP